MSKITLLSGIFLVGLLAASQPAQAQQQTSLTADLMQASQLGGRFQYDIRGKGYYAGVDYWHGFESFNETHDSVNLYWRILGLAHYRPTDTDDIFGLRAEAHLPVVFPLGSSFSAYVYPGVGLRGVTTFDFSNLDGDFSANAGGGFLYGNPNAWGVYVEADVSYLVRSKVADVGVALGFIIPLN